VLPTNFSYPRAEARASWSRFCGNIWQRLRTSITQGWGHDRFSDGDTLLGMLPGLQALEGEIAGDRNKNESKEKKS
jgi:hypothetical protein